jgi:glycerol kinase
MNTVIAAIALDLGSTSVKAALLQSAGELTNVVSMPAPEVMSRDGCYESDALAYVKTAEQVLAQCLAQTKCLPPLGLCSQRSSFLLWETASGQPLTPLISWQDTRGAASCEALRDSEPPIRELSGLRLAPYYFAPKLRVLLQEFPHWREHLQSGKYLVGTLDTFLIWRWTGGKQFVTDASMASRTLLMDIRQQQWSPELCKIFGIPPGILPQIIPSSGLTIRLDNGLTLQASMGDQSAAFVASVGADSNAALVNLGTGGFVLRDMAQADNSLNGYLRTLLYQDNAGYAHIAVEGTLNSIAVALSHYPVGECRVEDLAESDIFCLTEPSGLGAPYFRNDFGLHFSQHIEHLTPRQIATLLLEGIVFRLVRILEDFHCVSAIGRVYLSGGLSELACLQQGIAQCAPMTIYRLQQKEASLQGAGLLGAGIFNADRELLPIVAATDASRLREKYRLWKIWLDELLKS